MVVCGSGMLVSVGESVCMESGCVEGDGKCAEDCREECGSGREREREL